jgi:hypothetical protein
LRKVNGDVFRQNIADFRRRFRSLRIEFPAKLRRGTTRAARHVFASAALLEHIVQEDEQHHHPEKPNCDYPFHNWHSLGHNTQLSFFLWKTGDRHQF